MEVTQIYELMNDVTKEVLGESAVVNEDLSNVVDIGNAILDVSAMDNYSKALINRIGKTIFVNRAYSGSVPSVLMDKWEFGSILQKISADLPEATANESWELTDGASYDPFVFVKPRVSSKYFNKRVTFEVQLSFTEKQLKESFLSAEALNAFISMLYNAIDKSITVKLDALVMETINNMIAETIHADMPSGTYTGKGSVKAINVLKRYNDKFGTSLTFAEAITNAEFIKFCSYLMRVTVVRLRRLSTLFNIEKKPRFTSADHLHMVLLTDFKSAADVYLQSEVFHNEFTSLPNAEEVPFWQGSGEEFGIEDISSINVKDSSGDTVTVSGILGVMFDRDALAVTNLDKRVTTAYNPKGEFYNNFYKNDAGAFNDKGENFVVFYAM